ncbi:MAG: tRNA (adenosine(37)-N6)-threonylcarbamoyltransferase complex transferase subunit TsaD [Gemmatimonadales bacterium]
MRILGLETSCDETSAAVVHRDGDTVTIEGLAILSQDVHRIFGGVVPELASRAHLVAIDAVVDDALAQANAGIADIDAVAVTRGPGLLGALLVGVTWAKTVAWREGLPLIGVHHLEGHLFAATLESSDVRPPFTALLVSGGHTMLLDVPAWGEYLLLGQTRDDAVGEAFDKVGSLLGLDYPAGAVLERLAATGDPARFVFPRPLLKNSAKPKAQRPRAHPARVGPWASGFELSLTATDPYAFSFSGLKTAVLRAVQQSPDVARDRAAIARGFQDAAIDVLVAKTAFAAQSFHRDLVVIGGGVACNRALTEAMRGALLHHARVAVATPRLNTDNAAMIAAAGSWRLMQGEHDGPDLDARDALPLPGLRLPTGAIA